MGKPKRGWAVRANEVKSEVLNSNLGDVNKDKPRRKAKSKWGKAKKIYIGLILVILCGLLYDLMNSAILETTIQDITFPEFKTYWDAGKVIELEFESSGLFIFKIDSDTELRRAPTPMTDEERDELLLSGVKVNAKPDYNFTYILLRLMPIFFIVFLILLVSRFVAPMVVGMKKESAFEVIDTTGVTFKDVAGLDEVKDELSFIISSLENRKLLTSAGGRVTRGVLLSGPPGVGKTLLAKAVAGEAKIPFIFAAGSAFQSSYINIGVGRIEALIKLARDNAPCVVFIDEAESLFSRRGRRTDLEKDSGNTLNKLLQEMDGMKNTDGILIVAATNNAHEMDEAALRPGRFDRHISIQAPSNSKDRNAILNVHLLGKKLDENLTVEQISDYFIGLTGAEIEGALNEAVIESVRTGSQGIIKHEHIDIAIMKFLTKGVMRSSDEHDREVAATHEAGHALLNLVQGIDVVRASIKSFGSTGGAVIPKQDEHLLRTQSDLEKRIRVLYAGLAAEKVIYGEHSTGCSNDLQKATELIDTYVNQVGMGSFIQSRNIQDGDIYFNECEKVGQKLLAETEEIVRCNADKLKGLSQCLLDEDTIFNLSASEF